MLVRSLVLLIALVAAPAAMAQTGKHLALGASVGTSKYIDDHFHSKNIDISPSYRLSLKTDRKDGWSWALKSGLGWSRRDVSGEVGGSDADLGKLQTVLIMGGGQRVFRQGPFQAGAGIVAGPSFNRFDVGRAARDAYQSRLGVPLDDIKVKTSVAVRPDVSAWYDLNQWVAVGATVSYTFNRPKTETTAGGVTSESTWKTDHTSASVGFVVGIF